MAGRASRRRASRPVHDPRN